MQNMRWVNPNHPQTLNIGVILLYIDAFFLVLGGAIGGIGLILAVASVGAGVGIANDKRIAYYLGLAVSAIVPALLLRLVIIDGLDTLFDTNFLLGAIFPVAQLAALAHPQSRSYTKIWFE